MVNFLPNRHDIEMPLTGNAAVAALGMGTGVYRDTVQNRRHLPKATKTKLWVMKMFSAFTFLGLIFGGTIFGFSFKVIGDNQVGYYKSESGYMGPGTYFQFPWTKEDMQVVDVGYQFLRINRFMGGMLNDEEFEIQNANVVYKVTDVDTYIRTLKDDEISPEYCKGLIEITVIDNISGTPIQELLSRKELQDINVPECGINVKKVIVSKPITHTLFMNNGIKLFKNEDVENEEENEDVENEDVENEDVENEDVVENDNTTQPNNLNL